MEKKNQQDWISIIKQEPNKGLKEIYKDHQKEFVGWLGSNYNCSEDDANDLFQETIIVLYRNIVNGKLTTLSSSIKTYLYAIGKNLALKAALKPKKANVDIELVRESVTNENLYYQQIEAKELNDRKKRILEGLKNLKNPCQTILHSFYYEKLSLKQISDKLGYSNTNVAKTQKYRCMAKFLKSMK